MQRSTKHACSIHIDKQFNTGTDALQVLNTLATKNFQAIFLNISQKLLYTLPSTLHKHLKLTSPESYSFPNLLQSTNPCTVQKMVSKARCTNAVNTTVVQHRKLFEYLLNIAILSFPDVWPQNEIKCLSGEHEAVKATLLKAVVELQPLPFLQSHE